MISIKYSEFKKFSFGGEVSVVVIAIEEGQYSVFLEFPNGDYGKLVVQNSGVLKVYKSLLTVERDVLSAGYTSFTYKLDN